MRKTILCSGFGVSAALALSLAAQAQETCATAVAIGMGSTPFTAGATTDDNPGETCNGFSTNDVFFTFTPATTGAYQFETCNTDPNFYDTVLSVYSGTCGATTQLACNDDSGVCGTNGWSSRVTVNLTGGETYIVRVGAYDEFSLGNGQGQITISSGVAGPANDHCADAIVVGLGSTPFDTTGATSDATTNCGGSGPDIFYSFTPAASGAYQIDTCGSTYDSTLSVKTDCFTEIACGDDECGSQSLINVGLTGGQTYIIQVDGFGGAFGAGTLNIGAGTPPPANDQCTGATAVVLGANTVDNSGGLTDDTNCGNTRDTWYFFTNGGAAGPYTFSTCGGSTLDTVLTVYDGCGGSVIGCNDQACASNQSSLVVNLAAGQTVYVSYGTWNNTTAGSSTLTIEPTVIPLSASDTYPGAVELGTVLLEVPVTPGDPPPSSGIDVSVDLSTIGGSATQTFYDDNTHGDLFAGDNVFSYSYTLPMSVVGAGYTLPASVTDDQSRTATANINLFVNNGPSGACCTAGTCSIARETTCAPGGGSWMGAGSSCGGNAYTMTTTTDSFIDISATGTLLATVSGCDDCTENVALPFSFSHLGNSYTSVDVSSNGNIQFSSPNAAFGNTPIPDAATPNDALYPMWDDLYPVGAGDIYFLDDSVANGRVIISWQGVASYPNATPEYDFQVILHSNGTAEFRYGNITPEATTDDYTVGWEDITGTLAGSVPGSSLGAGNTAIALAPTTIPGPCGATCDTIDFNHDDLFPDTADIDDFLTVFSGGLCSNDPNCGDIDFNNDGLFPDTLDIDALISVFSGGPCLQ